MLSIGFHIISVAGFFVSLKLIDTAFPDVKLIALRAFVDARLLSDKDRDGKTLKELLEAGCRPAAV